jgi:Fe-S-cluster containining protein
VIEFSIAEFARSTFSEPPPGAANRQVVAQRMRAIADLAERCHARMRKAGDSPQPPVCRAGCSHCCYMRVVATVPEMIALADFIAANFPPKTIESIRRRVVETDMKTHGLSDEQWGVAHHACPMLVDGKCSVYPARPLECRGYNSTNIESCRAAAENYLEWDVPMDIDLMAAFKSAQAGVLQALTRLGHPPRLVELTAALRVILEDPTAVDRWFDGENPFASAELDPGDPEQRAFLPWVPSDELRVAAELEEP